LQDFFLERFKISRFLSYKKNPKGRLISCLILRKKYILHFRRPGPSTRDPFLDPNRYNIPETQVKYNIPETQVKYNIPETQVKYNLPETQVKYNIPETQVKYNLPETQLKYNLPETQVKYNIKATCWLN